MRRKTGVIGLAAVGGTLLTAGVALAAVPNMQDAGFPTVTASTYIGAGQAATITVPGGLSVHVPAGTFPAGVTFKVLGAPSAHFASEVPAGQTPLEAFAFQVTGPAGLIGTFQPILLAYTNPGIASSSQYLNVLPTGTVAPNPVTPKIAGTTLTHPINAAGVGWVITGPVATVPAATSPVTGLPILPLEIAGAVLAVAGGILLLRRKV